MDTTKVFTIHIAPFKYYQVLYVACDVSALNLKLVLCKNRAMHASWLAIFLWGFQIRIIFSTRIPKNKKLAKSAPAPYHKTLLRYVLSGWALMQQIGSHCFNNSKSKPNQTLCKLRQLRLHSIRTVTIYTFIPNCVIFFFYTYTEAWKMLHNVSVNPSHQAAKGGQRGRCKYW